MLLNKKNVFLRRLKTCDVCEQSNERSGARVKKESETVSHSHVRGVRLAGFARESHASALLFVKPILRKHDDCLAVELTYMTNCP